MLASESDQLGAIGAGVQVATTGQPLIRALFSAAIWRQPIQLVCSIFSFKLKLYTCRRRQQIFSNVGFPQAMADPVVAKVVAIAAILPGNSHGKIADKWRKAPKKNYFTQQICEILKSLWWLCIYIYPDK